MLDYLESIAANSTQLDIATASDDLEEVVESHFFHLTSSRDALLTFSTRALLFFLLYFCTRLVHVFRRSFLYYYSRSLKTEWRVLFWYGLLAMHLFTLLPAVEGSSSWCWKTLHDHSLYVLLVIHRVANQRSRPSLLSEVRNERCPS